MYTFPFTEDSVREEICERTMMVGLQEVGGNEIFNIKEVVLKPEVEAEGINWSVQNGVLLLEDEQAKVTHDIDAVEIINGKVCLGGYSYRQASARPARVVMYERLELGADFHVVVSSHVDYEEVALPRLVRSLARYGVPDGRVTVVVGGASGEPSQDKGYRRIPVEANLLGSTALEYLTEDCDITSGYVLLLHDTCEAMPGFADDVKSLDVGMPYDMYWFWHEIGLWSTSFLKRVKAEGFEKQPPQNISRNLRETAKLVRRFTNMQQRKAKDVYGQGVTRTVYEFPELGVKKYVGRNMTGGRP